MRLLKALFHPGRVREVGRCVAGCRRPWGAVARYVRPGAGAYPYRMELTNGVKLDLRDSHDTITAWLVFFRGEYHVPADAKAILDIGANIGCFALKAAADFPAARVVAVEPYPPTYARLAGHVAANGLADRVTTWQLAVGGKADTRGMRFGGVSQYARLAAGGAPGAGDGDGVTVSVITLADAVDRACAALGVDELDFVKMDIEGAEHEAVGAAPAEAFARIRVLGIEYHGNRPKAGLFAALEAAGMRLREDRVEGQDLGVAHFVRAAAPAPAPARG